MALLKKLKGPFEKELLLGSDNCFLFYEERAIFGKHLRE